MNLITTTLVCLTVLQGCSDKESGPTLSLDQQKGFLDGVAIQMAVQAMTSRAVIKVDWTALSAQDDMTKPIAQKFYDLIMPLGKAVQARHKAGHQYPFKPYVLFSRASQFLKMLQGSNLYSPAQTTALMDTMLDQVKKTMNKPEKTDLDHAYEAMAKSLGEDKQTDKLYILYQDVAIVELLEKDKDRLILLIEKFLELQRVVVANANTKSLKDLEKPIERLTHKASDHGTALMFKTPFDAQVEYQNLVLSL